MMVSIKHDIVNWFSLMLFYNAAYLHNCSYVFHSYYICYHKDSKKVSVSVGFFLNCNSLSGFIFLMVILISTEFEDIDLDKPGINCQVSHKPQLQRALSVQSEQEKVHLLTTYIVS